jgi:integrase
MPPRYRTLVIVAAFSSLRWGELAALRRRDIDTTEGVVKVPRKLAALRNRMEFGPPKSQAGKRAVVLPQIAREVLDDHLKRFVDNDPDAIVFTSSRNTLLRSSNFTQATKWTKLRVELGLPEGFTFHDLRHTGNNLASATGANIRELMRRMGHSTMRAALIYQHGSLDRDHEIAKAMDDRVKGTVAPTVFPARSR